MLDRDDSHLHRSVSLDAEEITKESETVAIGAARGHNRALVVYDSDGDEGDDVVGGEPVLETASATAPVLNSDEANLLQPEVDHTLYDSESGDKHDNAVEAAPSEQDEGREEGQDGDGDDYERVTAAFMNAMGGEIRVASRSVNMEAVRRMEWEPAATFYEATTDRYPHLPIKFGCPTADTRRAAASPLALSFHFFRKALWVEICSDINQFRLQTLDARAKPLKAKQKKRREVDMTATIYSFLSRSVGQSAAQTAWFCEARSQDSAKVLLHKAPMGPTKDTLSCFDVWHDALEYGQRIPESIENRITLRRMPTKTYKKRSRSAAQSGRSSSERTAAGERVALDERRAASSPRSASRASVPIVRSTTVSASDKSATSHEGLHTRQASKR
ncbi:hypothetical protein PybrP1_010494 [[Pythium] brassicae (nom. inval.)]|nr:hypothetical protein PybrP1_010494 [[Pythium] brassicae (nom. inval.)]